MPIVRGFVLKFGCYRNYIAICDIPCTAKPYYKNTGRQLNCESDENPFLYKSFHQRRFVLSAVQMLFVLIIWEIFLYFVIFFNT